MAGTWYPADPARLRHEVARHLDAAAGPRLGEVRALIVPHAGLVYSGPVAAHAYLAAQGGLYDAIVLAGPSHYVAFDGVSIYPRGAFDTPLGPIPIASDVADALIGASREIHPFPAAHQREHSLEMQLPFLRTVLPDVPIVPLVMGYQVRETILDLARALSAALAGRRILLIASTDLSHFFDSTQAARLDSRVIDCVSRFDPAGLLAELESYPEGERGRYVACGGGPAVSVMMAARELGADGTRILKYADSGDVSGDKGSVVGYLAAAIGHFKGDEHAPDDRATAILTGEDRRNLLQIARSAITVRLARSESINPQLEGALARPGAAFVTLSHGGELRGCIGNPFAHDPLGQVVARCAAASATEDPRFLPLTIEELPDVALEISVLGPLERLAPTDEIEIGRHGLMVEQGARRGLLLPQVAMEWNWDRATFLAQTCRKAGLPPDAWRRGAAVFRFEAEIIKDNE